MKTEQIALLAAVVLGGLYLYNETTKTPTTPPGVPPGTMPFTVVLPDGTKTQAWLNFAGQLVNQAGQLITHFFPAGGGASSTQSGGGGSSTPSRGGGTGIFQSPGLPYGPSVGYYQYFNTGVIGVDDIILLIPEDGLELHKGTYMYNGKPISLAQPNQPFVV